MVSTWAWVWSAKGPIKLDVEGGYQTGLDWSTLHCTTWIWPKGKYPGKIGVDTSVDAWFELNGTSLTVKRAVARKDDGGDEKRWP